MDTFIITCEHGGSRVPAPYREPFRDRQELLDSHRGWDSGALEMAKALAADYREQIVERVNQALVFAAGRRWTALRAMLIDSLHAACAP